MTHRKKLIDVASQLGAEYLANRYGAMADTALRQGTGVEQNLTRLEDLGAVARLERERFLLEGFLGGCDANA